MKLEKKELLHLRRALLAYAPSKMTEHLKHKLTEALQALEAQRRVWDWLQGKPVPAYAQRLLHIWGDCTPAQRQKWYS